MAQKGIGIKECKEHGEFHADAEDSPCPSCEDEIYPVWCELCQTYTDKSQPYGTCSCS